MRAINPIKTVRCAAAAGLATFVAFGLQANAKDITIFDSITGNTYGTADSRVGINEDNEVEPHTAIGQNWDLEAFLLDGEALSMVGGWNFMNGGSGFASGDIFIDVNGDANYGSPLSGAADDVGTIVSNSLYKYDYVISFGGRTIDPLTNRSVDKTLDGTYKIYKLSGSSSELTVSFVGDSNPWIYHSGGTEIASGTVTQKNLGTSDQLGLTGGQHYELEGMDLSALGTGPNGLLFHFTMECGNDLLMGYSPIPDGGSVLCQIGLGLIGIAAAGRRLRK